MAPAAANHSTARSAIMAWACRSQAWTDPLSRGTGTPYPSRTDGSIRTRESAEVTSWIGPITRSERRSRSRMPGLASDPQRGISPAPLRER